MNSQILLNNSELALASYATLNTDDLILQTTALQEAGFSNLQAANFASRYSVVTQFDDISETGNSSFNATVFKDADGNLTLAFRGTLEAADFVPTDFDIWKRGAGYDQIIAMCNWWSRVSNSSGQLVDQYQLSILNKDEDAPSNSVELYSFNGNSFYLEKAPSAVASGELADELNNDIDGLIDVSGHSLGAHLALAFNTLFPDITNEVTGFNTPGFKIHKSIKTFSRNLAEKFLLQITVRTLPIFSRMNQALVTSPGMPLLDCILRITLSVKSSVFQ